MFLSVDNALAQGSVAEDRAALVALYNATGGANWTDNTNWLSNEALSEWHGVTTNSDGRVTRLDLNNNQLTGPIPAALGDLTSLQWLYLYNNQLTGSIPAELGNLANLESLNLNINQLTGEIPAELGNLANLQTLYLQNNQLTGEIPAALGNLGSLQHLHLNINQLDGTIPVELGSLANLEDLYLWGNELSGAIPVELGSLTELKQLFLSQNQLSGTIPVELGGLTSLLYLRLNQNQLSGTIPVELGSLANLQQLYLYDNQLSGAIPVELGNLTNLSRLYLNQNQLSGTIPAELGGLVRLQYLRLYDNQLTGSIPTQLGGLTSLQRLRLENNQLTGSIPTQLGGLTNLQWLLLNGNQLTGSIPVELGNLANLQYLYLHVNRLSGAIPAELGDLANLLWLYLRDNELSGEIPVELGSLTSLQRLYLQDNELTGTIPPDLGGLTSLQRLRLENNQLTGSIPTQLGGLTNLQWLLLNGNQLTGSIPVELGNLANLQYLYLHVNRLSGAIPAELGGLTSLLYLYLHENQLDGTIPTQLGSLTSLQRLYLHENMLSGEIPAALGSLPSLAILSLYDNPQLYNYPANLDTKANLSLLAPSTGEALCLPTTQGGADCTIPVQVDRLRLTPGPTRIVVRWEPKPAIPTPTTGYSVEYYDAGGWRADNVSISGTTATITGLTPGSYYDVRVRPDAATTPWLQSGVTLPTRSPSTGGGGGATTSAPGAPRNLTVVGGDGQVVLSWEAPESDGGAEITDYEYRINGRGPWISIGSTLTTHTVTGLVNGTEYTFQVRAVNRRGRGRGRASNRIEAKPEVFTLDFTHFANGDGITSDLVFVNVGTHPIRPALYFYDQEGQPMAADSVVEITGDLEIQEDGGLSIQTAMEPLGELTIPTHGQGELVTGSARSVAGGPIGGMLRYNIPEVGVAGVGASPPTRDALFPARRQEGGINTGVAVHNLGEEAMEVTCELMQGGTVLGDVRLPLAANGQVSWFIDEMFPATDTSDFTGSVRCTAPGEGTFAGVAVELDAANRIFTTLPVLSTRRAGGRAAELNFAHFANGAGLTSDLVFVNLSTERSRPAPTPFHSDILPVRPAIYFYDTEGALVSAESVVDLTGDLEVMEDGGLTVQTEMEPLGVLTISTHGRGELVSGSVRVIADEPIGGGLRFDLPEIGVAGVGVSSPVHDALFPVRRQEAGINTGVAIHNLESSAVLVRCDLMQEGVLRDAVPIPLAANGQVSWFIDEMFPATDTSDFTGSVRCTAPGEGTFAGVAVELDAANRIFTTLPVVPVPERTDRE